MKQAVLFALAENVTDVELRREFHPYDRNAIAVILRGHTQDYRIGYVAREEARFVPKTATIIAELVELRRETCVIGIFRSGSDGCVSQ